MEQVRQALGLGPDDFYLYGQSWGGILAMEYALAHGDSEFDLTGLGTAASRVVSPPRLAESPVAFECRTMQVMRLAPGVAGGANVVVGEIVHLYVRDDIVDEGFHVLPDRLPAIGRLGNLGYCTIRDRFDLPRGRAALTDDGL